MLSLNISISPPPNPVSGTWFQNLQGCFGNEESQGIGESHVLGSDSVADDIQQVKYLKTRERGRKGAFSELSPALPHAAATIAFQGGLLLSSQGPKMPS